jgi:high-affinity iron transporter
MRKFGLKILAIGFCLMISLVGIAPGWAQEKRQFENWTEIAEAMEESLNKAYESYFQKDIEAGKNWVNDAYFGYYEKEGFERTVMSYLSGKRGAQVEYQFTIIKKMMTEQRPNKEVRGATDDLIKWLKEDAHQLDGTEESGLGVFVAALMIILREGVEAILVIAAIAAYLIRSGNGAKTRVVYQSAAGAVVASVAAAIGLQYIFNISGANQEILEGVAMLLATVVLFFVSNWMFSKAEAAVWKSYIEGKVQSAVATGSAFALGAAAFLSVFREGAETILFYQAMLADVETHTGMIWLGFGVGSLCLVAVFIIIRFGTMKLPLKPFFLGTSILMYLMAIAFAGGGIKELQEGDVIGVTPVNLISSVDLLGIYPTVETLLPQAVLVILVLVSIFCYRWKNKNVPAAAA